MAAFCLGSILEVPAVNAVASKIPDAWWVEIRCPVCAYRQAALVSGAGPGGPYRVGKHWTSD